MRRLGDWLFALWISMRISVMVLPALWHVIWGALAFVGSTLLLFWSGTPQKVRAIATEWQKKAHDAGVPGTWDPTVYWVLYIAAFVTMIFGWIVCSYLTVWLVRLVF